MGRPKGKIDDRICQECGNAFVHISPKKKFCSTECMLSHNRRIYAWKKKLEQMQDKQIESVEDVNAKALASGMSYGDYVAKQWMEQNKWVRKW